MNKQLDRRIGAIYRISRPILLCAGLLVASVSVGCAQHYQTGLAASQAPTTFKRVGRIAQSQKLEVTEAHDRINIETADGDYVVLSRFGDRIVMSVHAPAEREQQTRALGQRLLSSMDAVVKR